MQRYRAEQAGLDERVVLLPEPPAREGIAAGRAGFAFLQPLRGIADDVLGNRDLLEALGLHEIVAHLVFVEVVVLFLVEIGALDLIGRAVALADLHAVGDAAHVELGDGRALAGMDVLGVDDDGELAVEIEHIALAHRRGDHLAHVVLH